MTAGVYNITIEQGADFNLPLTYTDLNSNPINLTGWSAEMMIRQNYTDPTPLVTLSSPSSGITLGGTAGTIVIEIPGAATETLVAASGYYDLKMTDSLGDLQRLIQGTVTISPAVTR